jgi:hypothetical protein
LRMKDPALKESRRLEEEKKKTKTKKKIMRR